MISGPCLSAVLADRVYCTPSRQHGVEVDSL